MEGVYFKNVCILPFTAPLWKPSETVLSQIFKTNLFEETGGRNVLRKKAKGNFQN